MVVPQERRKREIRCGPLEGQGSISFSCLMFGSTWEKGRVNSVEVTIVENERQATSLRWAKSDGCFDDGRLSFFFFFFFTCGTTFSSFSLSPAAERVRSIQPFCSSSRKSMLPSSANASDGSSSSARGMGVKSSSMDSI